ncbi:MAG: hypothetical protein KKB30_14180 [Proteobacteria bacterium]|nr:hypothetical protein [Pseudomonadota bacterium]MBU1715999.1 hypothetical protein [Pseudomonadota bacterium]
MNKTISSLQDHYLPMLLLVAVAFGLGCTPIWDWDIWWHLGAGQLILEKGALPFVDQFTYGSANEPWIDLHWLFQVLVTFLYNCGGINLLVLAKAVLLAAGVLICWIATGRQLPVWLKVSVLFMVTLCLDSRGSLRPELLSFILLATWLYVLKFRIPENPRAIWVLPLIQVIWVNCHGLFVLGLVVYAAFLISLATGKLLPGIRKPSQFSLQTLCWLTLAVVGASFCSPYLEKGAIFPLVLYSRFSTEGDFYSYQVGEFLPFFDCIKVYGLFDIPLFSEIILFCLACLSFILLWKARRIDVFRIVLFVAFTHLALLAWRNIGVFAVVAGIVTCWNFGDWLAFDRDMGVSRPRIYQVMISKISWAQNIPVLLLGVVCFLLFSGHSAFFAFAQMNIGLGERPDFFLHGASIFAGREGLPKRAFIPWDQAAVYEFHNGPEYKVFMDGRLEVNTRQAFERHNYAMDRMALSDPNWVIGVLDESGTPPLVILDKRGSLQEIIGLAKIPGWVPVYSDIVAVVFVTEIIARKLRLSVIPGQYIL